MNFIGYPTFDPSIFFDAIEDALIKLHEGYIDTSTYDNIFLENALIIITESMLGPIGIIEKIMDFNINYDEMKINLKSIISTIKSQKVFKLNKLFITDLLLQRFSKHLVTAILYDWDSQDATSQFTTLMSVLI